MSEYLSCGIRDAAAEAEADAGAAWYPSVEAPRLCNLFPRKPRRIGVTGEVNLYGHISLSGGLLKIRRLS